MSAYLLHLLEGTQLLQEAPPGCLLSLQPSLGADWLLQDPAEEIKDSDSNPIVCDKAVSADMAIKTGLLDLTSDSDTVAEVVLSQWEIPIYLLEMEKTFPPHYINISRKCTFQFQVCA